MSTTNIQRLVYMLQDAFDKLGALYSLNSIEELAILVHEAMSAQNRKFHTTEHIFSILGSEENPHLTLAAIFHDVVYHSVDGGFTEHVESILKNYVAHEHDQFFIRKRALEREEFFNIVNQIFGYKQGHFLVPINGMNEYMSALVAAKMLVPIIGLKNIIPTLVCIESSIPFRKKDDEGKSPFDKLEERINNGQIFKKFKLNKNEIIEMVELGVHFANMDVANFADPQAVTFLDNTWKLLPESNPTLITNKVYTIKKYRQALEKMEMFFNKIDPHLIFHSYKNFPSENVHSRLIIQAQKNVQMGRYYLAGRLLSTSILEALSEVSGGDAPVLMFLGSNTKGNMDSKYEFNEMIRKAPVDLASDIDPTILTLFEYESQGSILDFRKTPLAAFIYKSLGSKRMLEVLDKAKLMFKKEINPQDFLKEVGPKIIGPIANACSYMISTRKDQLKKWSQN